MCRRGISLRWPARSGSPHPSASWERGSYLFELPFLRPNVAFCRPSAPFRVVDSHPAPPDSAREDRAPQASELVAACEAVWSAIQRNHPEVPDAVIVLGTGVERGRLVKLGHWWGGRWIADGDLRGEVLLAGEALHLAPEAVFEVLLHEAAHGLNAARGIQDSSRGGRYHNARFKTTAQDLGLVVHQAPPYGWARTSLGRVAADRYETEIAGLGEAMRIARQVATHVRVGESTIKEGADDDKNGGTRSRHNRQQAATCGCGRRLRMAPSVLAQGPVLCGLCGREFSTSRSIDDRVSPRRDAEAAQDPRRAPDEYIDAPLGQSSGHADLSTTQREGLSALVELGTHGDGALLLAEAGAWYAARCTGEQRSLLGTTWQDVDTANQVARAMLKLDGTLNQPSVTAAGRELAVGELVMIRDSTDTLLDVLGVELPPFAVFGTIEHIDPDRHEIVIDFATAGRHTIALDSPVTVALEYGYADHAATTTTTAIEIPTLPRTQGPEPLAIELDP